MSESKMLNNFLNCWIYRECKYNLGPPPEKLAFKFNLYFQISLLHAWFKNSKIAFTITYNRFTKLSIYLASLESIRPPGKGFRKLIASFDYFFTFRVHWKSTTFNNLKLQLTICSKKIYNLWEQLMYAL